MTDKEHAERIFKILAELMVATSDAKEAGLTVRIEPVNIGAGITSFSADVKRITPIARFP